MDISLLRARAHQVLLDATIPELPNHYSGKVRDNYDLPGGRRVLIATDRLSAFDRILCAVPFKGQVLTQTARWWFEQTADLCPNHVLSYPDPNVVVARRLAILPVEVVVRGYLAGTTGTSVLTLYKAGQRAMYGIRLPDGMRDNERLPAPIITPTSKEFDGGHDAPLSADEIVRGGLLTAAQWAQLTEYALALFARGQALAAERGLILADTKYEFGTDAEGRIVLADEIHTPDSSRFWRASSYQARFEAGERPESFDKDFVRNWVASRCDPYRDPIPEIPEEHILATAAVYIEAFETITGQAFHLPEDPGPVLDRIRRNLAPLIADATTIGDRGAGDDYPLPGAGQSPANFDAAIAFHRAHETAWPASMYLPNGHYVGTSAIGDRPEFAAVIGPVKPRGGPNGLILQHGRVVAEWGDTARTDMTFSIAKSYLALLAGLAVQDGLIADLDAPVAKDVPGPWFASPHNARITWRHLLQQTSEWQGTLWGKPDIADHNRVVGSSAGAKAGKGEARTLAEPGSHFEYNDVRVNLLAACLTHRFGRALPDVLRERVMNPIGASDAWEWHGYEGSVLEPEGRALRCVSGGGHWGGGQFIGSHDHARMGQLVLQGGVWEGRQIVPAAWVRTMVAPSPCNDQYGMLWWLNGGVQPLFPSAPRDSVFALGAGRSLIWIAPSLSMVTVLRWLDRDSTDGMLGAIMQAVTR